MRRLDNDRASALARTVGVTLLTAVLGAMGPARPIHAADPATAPGQEEQAEVSAAEATDETTPTPIETEESPAGQSGGDVFLPSEDISEDFAVSFPVDI